MIVMLLSGLWHGAGWTFILWGALHGVASCENKAVGKNLKALGKYANILITFIFVTLFWVVFRADSIETAWKVWSGMFTAHTGISQPYTWSFVAVICLVIGTAGAIIHSRKKGIVDKRGNAVVDGFYPVLDLTKIWCLVAFFTFCGLTIILGYYGNTAFIYGAF